MHDGSSDLHVPAASHRYIKLATAPTVGTRPRELIAFPSVDARSDVVDDWNGQQLFSSLVEQRES